MVITPTIINAIVTASNIFFIVPVYTCCIKSRYSLAILSGLVFTASTLMHISETKHDLPGLFLVKHSNTLLQLDRVSSYIGIIVSIIILYNRGWPISKKMLINGFIGLVSLYLSENTFTKNQLAFMIFHIVWHFCASHLMNTVFLL